MTDVNAKADAALEGIEDIDGDDEAPPYADIVNIAMEFTIRPAHKMGIEAVEVRPGFAKLKAPLAGNGNHFGTIYAGVLFALAEMLGGALAVAAFDNSQYYPLVKGVDIKFTEPARSDVTATASMDEDTIKRVTAEADADGKSDYTLEAEVTDENDVVVAVTTGNYQLRAHDT